MKTNLMLMFGNIIKVVKKSIGLVKI